MPSNDSITLSTRCFKGEERYYWEMETSLPNGSSSGMGKWTFRLGVADKSALDCPGGDLWQQGWSVNGIGSVHSKRMTIGSTKSYNKTEERVGFLLDMKERTVKYFLGGKFIDTVFTDLPDEIYLAASNGIGAGIV
eukprot:CAMPEP_0168530342 /NCGR_PEP_ID=MMETSP0405-20121227/14598_1 /TAXON_ID=498012 /ORGANISM="Trichosphaerium sp, Strain Am-I-7 wt" /LENGTH=135 /DNA_ID=CAMNT_0008554541 /DNA_START=228 /DNA_END=631 /DNA_ORIENTATION=-